MKARNTFYIFLLFVLASCTDNKKELVEYKNIAEIYQTKEPYKDVLQELLFAIEDEGMVLSYHSHVSKMLERTQKDLGYKNIPYENAEVVGFCKSNISHQVLSENPHSIIFCPYSIAVYQIKNSKTTFLSHMKIPESMLKNTDAHKIKELLHRLIAKTGAKLVNQQ
jgi:uncharacterized protein (DUF302 family)